MAGEMMEGELIIVAFITSTFGLIGLMMINHNWITRQKIKYGYQLKRAKLSKKMSVPVQEEKTGFDTVKDLIPLLKGLDADQIGALADRFIGGGDEVEVVPAGGLEGILDNIPPEMISSFLKGLSKKDETKTDQDQFSSQVP